MFDLLTTEAFATWFSGLDAGPAEDVAATLEVIVELGPGSEAPGSSDLLLWYEHPLLAARPLPDPSTFLPPEVVQFSRDWGNFLGYVKRVVKHLESPQFTARLGRLSAKDADEVASAVARIRRVAKARPLAVSEFYMKRMKFAVRGPAGPDAAKMATLVDVGEVRAAYSAALAAAGFDASDVPPNSAALREISLRSASPGLRLLYGIDAARNRGLVVLGEWLDRSFYGDAVREAEAVWYRFLEGRPLPVATAAAR